MDYSDTALTESLGCLYTGKCRVAIYEKISRFPRDIRIRDVILLSGLGSGGLGRVGIRLRVSRLSLVTTRDGTACRRIGSCISGTGQVRD